MEAFTTFRKSQIQMITVLEVTNKHLYKQFLNLPYELHDGHQNWLPPIYSDDKAFFNRKKNVQFVNTDSILLLAFIDEKPVGRIMAIIPHGYNQRKNLKDVRFNYLESINNYEVLESLFNYVCKWGKEMGCDKLVGPLGFSDKEPQGLEIEGIEHTPLIVTNVNYGYIRGFIQRFGFIKKTDLVSFGIKVPEEYPTEYFEKYQSYLPHHKRLKTLDLKTRWGVWRYLRPAMNLINELFGEIYAHNPLKKRDIDDLVKRYALLLIPKYLKGILNEKNELVAFVIGMPDIAKGIQECNGRLFPFGFLKILRAQRRSKELILMIGGIKKEYRNIGLDYWLSIEIYKTIKEAEIGIVKGHLILEDNVKAHAKLLKFGGYVNKRFRIYQKSL